MTDTVTTNGARNTTEMPQMTQEVQTAYTEQERNAMRAYLQRCEVRMSTMHRVATAFIGGAGLLLLVPIFFKEILDGLINVLLGAMQLYFPMFDYSINLTLSAVLLLSLVYLLAVSIAIPLYALYLLIKDIVHFYFTIYVPNFPATLQHPSFSLAPILFSPDESPKVKRAVMRYQYRPGQIEFIAPFSEEKMQRYFDEMERNTHEDILPRSRSFAKLHEMDAIPDEMDEKEVERFNIALGLARATDRNLIDEVAATEMLMVRNVVYLRRMVLRYAKALLMFIWTAFLSFIILPVVQDGRFPTLAAMAAGYLLWSLFVLRIMHLPVIWIYRFRRADSVPEDQVDAQLNLVERTMGRYAYIARVVAIVALLMALLAGA